MQDGNKKRSVLEMIVCYAAMAVMTAGIAVFGADAGILAGVLAYWIPCAVLLFYVLKVEKKPLSSVGLKPVCARQVLEGFGLGILMFIVQQIPLLLMKIDYSAYAMAPDAVYIAVMLLYCFFLRGFFGGAYFSGVSAEKDAACFSSKMDLRGNQRPAFLSDPLVYHAA